MTPYRIDDSHDIVYLVKPDAVNEELRYSLRSVEKNFPHKQVWFYGGCPADLKPDRYAYYDQRQFGETKWERTTAMLEAACANEEITEWFWLFNDDFFIIEAPPSLFFPKYNGTMENRIKEIEGPRGFGNQYSRLLKYTQALLREAGMTTLNYAIHTPLLINRAKALETINRFEGCPMFRCLYGNMHRIGGYDGADVKVRDIDEEWDGRSWCMSTSDVTFEAGKAGKFIREQFSDPSRWELKNT